MEDKASKDIDLNDEEFQLTYFGFIDEIKREHLDF